MNSGLKRTIKWNKYQSKTTTQALKKFLDYLIDPSLIGCLCYHLKVIYVEQDMQGIIYQLWK